MGTKWEINTVHLPGLYNPSNLPPSTSNRLLRPDTCDRLWNIGLRVVHFAAAARQTDRGFPERYHKDSEEETSQVISIQAYRS